MMWTLQIFNILSIIPVSSLFYLELFTTASKVLVPDQILPQYNGMINLLFS